MGIVYLAHDVRLDRPVALKLLPEGLASRVEFRERFLREARTAAKLSHPNIIPIFSVDELREFVFFVMAYVQGETLGQRVRGRGPLSPSEGARVLKEIGLALSYAHSQGVVHRDVKPDNILLEEGSNRALVADFGIAGVVESSGAAGLGEIIGTVEFMSPEQASGRGVDARSDIYSLGVLGFYALSGSLPFQASSVAEVRRLHCEEPAPPLGRMTSAIPSRLARAIDRCLAKDPDSRFQSAHDFGLAMDATLLRRREIPVAVRHFLNDPVDLPGDGPLYYAFTTLVLVTVISILVSENVNVPLWIPPAVMFFPPVVLVVPRIRRLVKAGHDQRDLEAGLKVGLERRREELANAFGVEPPRWEKRAFSIARVAAGVSVAAFAGTFFGLLAPGPSYFNELAYVFATAMIPAAGAAAVAAGAGLASRVRRVDYKAERRYRFWKGRIGKWLFKLAGLGVKRTAMQTGLTHRPTELQIGFAAEGLFESLPRPLRKQLGDVPSVLRSLEADAQRLRETIRVLDEAQDAARVAGQAIPADVASARARTEEQLTAAVASLESVRLGLLRLTTGSGSVEGLTTDLAAASDVGHNIERLMIGIADVEAMLRPT